MIIGSEDFKGLSIQNKRQAGCPLLWAYLLIRYPNLGQNSINFAGMYNLIISLYSRWQITNCTASLIEGADYNSKAYRQAIAACFGSVLCVSQSVCMSVSVCVCVCVHVFVCSGWRQWAPCQCIAWMSGNLLYFVPPISLHQTECALNFISKSYYVWYKYWKRFVTKFSLMWHVQLSCSQNFKFRVSTWERHALYKYHCMPLLG